MTKFDPLPLFQSHVEQFFDPPPLLSTHTYKKSRPHLHFDNSITAFYSNVIVTFRSFVLSSWQISSNVSCFLSFVFIAFPNAVHLKCLLLEVDGYIIIVVN